MLAPVMGLCSAAAGYGQTRFVPGGFAAWKLLDSLTAQGGGATAMIEEEAKSQFDPITAIVLPFAAQAGVKVGSKLVSYVAQCALCDTGCPSLEEIEIQSDTSQDKKAAKIMAVMDALKDITAVEKQLNMKRTSMMKDDQMAEAELFDWISSAIDKVKSVAKHVKGFAKYVACDTGPKCSC